MQQEWLRSLSANPFATALDDSLEERIATEDEPLPTKQKTSQTAEKASKRGGLVAVKEDRDNNGKSESVTTTASPESSSPLATEDGSAAAAPAASAISSAATREERMMAQYMAQFEKMEKQKQRKM